MISGIIIGLLSGVVSGMGIGGGTILIPALTIFSDVNQQVAQGVNLIYFIPTATASLIVHFKNKAVDVKTALYIAVPGVFGAAAGAIIAGYISPGILRKIFGVFLFFMGIYEIFKKKK